MADTPKTQEKLWVHRQRQRVGWNDPVYIFSKGCSASKYAQSVGTLYPDVLEALRPDLVLEPGEGPIEVKAPAVTCEVCSDLFLPHDRETLQAIIADAESFH